MYEIQEKRVFKFNDLFYRIENSELKIYIRTTDKIDNPNIPRLLNILPLDVRFIFYNSVRKKPNVISN